MITEQDVANFRRLLDEGFSQGDLSVIDDIVSPNCVEHQRGNRPGPDGVKGTIRTLRSWFSDFQLTIEDLVVDGDKIWSRNVGRGVNTGSVMGHPPTGKTVNVEVYDVARFENGKLVEHWGVPDQLGMMLQLGVLPRPQPAPVR
jgi:predicted ester cyclase